MGIYDRDYYRRDGPSFLGTITERGRGICFWRFAAGTGYGRFVTTASDATR